MKTDFEERTLRQPINPFPDGDPDLAPRNINAPGSTAAGKSDDDDSNKVMCRICGPRIEGVIGVPNPDPTEPWPARNADGSEQNPFTEAEEFSQAEPSNAIRSAGTYQPNYTNYEFGDGQNNILIYPLLQQLEVNATDGVMIDMANPPGWDLVPSSGTFYMHGETIQYATKIGDGAGFGFGILTRNLPQADRTVKEPNSSIIILLGPETGNTSADITATVAADRSVSSYNLKDNLSRGRGFSDNSVLIIQNSELGGTNDAGGITLVQIRSTHWPDEDVSTCIVPEQGKEDVARQYCCFEDSLTGKDWSEGEGRCASLAQYNVARPDEWPQHCPDGFEYAPGDDGLFCKKCARGTSTFDPTLNPANCPADGVGCQKCCEDPGVSCP